jgi:GNAT superfamily N-acetyltransferase
MPEDWPAIAELLLFFGLPTDRVCARLSQYMVARIDTSFAGAASWCMSGGQFRICLVAVVPEWQHQNVGTALLSSLEDLALSRGITLPTVDLDDSSPFFADYSAEEEASRCDCRG